MKPERSEERYATRAESISSRLDELAGPDPDEYDRELLARMLSSFAQTSGDLLDELEAAIGADDATQAVQLAHSLKGSAANLGATRLAQLCELLEHEARLNPPRLPVEAVPPLREEWEAVRATISTIAPRWGVPPLPELPLN